MKSLSRLLLSAFGGSTTAAVLIAAAVHGQGRSPQRGDRHLVAFASDSDLSRFLALRAPSDSWRWTGPPCAGRMIVVRRTHDANADTTASAVVRGKVTNIVTGAATGQAYVTIENALAAEGTNAAGEFRLVVRPRFLGAAGSFVIRVRRIGYEETRAALAIAAGDSVDVDVRVCAIFWRGDMIWSVPPGPPPATGGSVATLQHANVDRPDIVKLAGEHLLILRGGKLFTVAIKGNTLAPAPAVDVFAPGDDRRYNVADALLVDRDRIIAVGHAAGVANVDRFDLDTHGALHYRDGYRFRTNDFKEQPNFRVVDGRLIWYAPMLVGPIGVDPLEALPSIRKRSDSTYHRIDATSHAYRDAEDLAPTTIALNTVVTCDLRRDDLACRTTVIVGQEARLWYVSPTAVYAWRSRARATADSASGSIDRIPLDGSAPTSLRITGTPVDQSSFFESNDGFLNVFMRSDSATNRAIDEANAANARNVGNASLLRIPLDAFGDGVAFAPPSAYRVLGRDDMPKGEFVSNRFIGDYLVYGSRAESGRTTTMFVTDWRNGTTVDRIAIPHLADRIEAMGHDAAIIGADAAGFHVTALAFGARVSVSQSLIVPGFPEGIYARAIFYRADRANAGVLGMLVRPQVTTANPRSEIGPGVVAFLRYEKSTLSSIGVLETAPTALATQDCEGPCRDSRPLFVRDRIFALFGGELVEGKITAGALGVVRRIMLGEAANRAP